MIAALILGFVLGATFAAVLVDVWFVQPMQRENRDLARSNRRALTGAEDWKRLAQDWRRHHDAHAGTPYLPSTVERAKVKALIEEIKARAEADPDDHSKAAELRIVQ
jgi:hypothetical protein